MVPVLFYGVRTSQKNFLDLRISQSRNILIFVLQSRKFLKYQENPMKMLRYEAENVGECLCFPLDLPEFQDFSRLQDKSQDISRFRDT